MPLVPISEISRLQLVSVAELVGLSLTWSHTSEDRFSHDLNDMHPVKTQISLHVCTVLLNMMKCGIFGYS